MAKERVLTFRVDDDGRNHFVADSGFLDGKIPTIKNGYEILSYTKVDDHYHAIVNRNTSCQPYTVALYYDPNDGSWGNGFYFDDYSSALKYFGEYLSK